MSFIPGGKGSLFCAVATLCIALGQSSSGPPGMMAPCPECAAAQQRDAAPGPPQADFIENPQPFRLDGRGAEVAFTTRLVSIRPLVLENLDTGNCGFQTMRRVDAKLKPALSRMKFNQLLKATLVVSGRAGQFPEFVLTGLTPVRQTLVAEGACFNRSGTVLSWHGAGEYIKVYNDGSYYYSDQNLVQFGSQRVPPAELAALLKSFADLSFDQLPSRVPDEGLPDSNSLTLVSARYQRVSTAGLETRLSPIIRQFEALKARALSRSFYMLLTSGRKKLTTLQWPFRDIQLSQIEAKWSADSASRLSLERPIPEDFLAQLPPPNPIAASVPAAGIFIADAGRIYNVVRERCGDPQRRCTAFGDLKVFHVPGAADFVSHPFPGAVFYSPVVLWPGDRATPLDQVGPEGRSIPQGEYEKNQAFYSRLYENSTTGSGQDFIEGDYLYLHVRMCRGDQSIDRSRCIDPFNQRR